MKNKLMIQGFRWGAEPLAKMSTLPESTRLESVGGQPGGPPGHAQLIIKRVS